MFRIDIDGFTPPSGDEREPPLPALRMIWPRARLAEPPAPPLPAGYFIRTYQPGDEASFLELSLESELWGSPVQASEGRDSSLSPEGLFFAVQRSSGDVAGMIMAIEHSMADQPRECELGGLAVAPAHRRQGLGQVLLGRATQFSIERGNRSTYLQTDETRLPGIRIYLALGYVPLLAAPADPERWEAICRQLRHPVAIIQSSGIARALSTAQPD